MKKFKLMAVVASVLVFLGSQAFASSIGYVNYKKVQENYPFAVNAIKEIDNQALALQQYIVDKEKEFKTIESPIQKKNFEQKAAKDFKVKEEAYMRLKLKKEEEVYNKIQAAAKTVMIEQKLDAVFDYRVIFVGGMDITDLVIQKLKNSK